MDLVNWALQTSPKFTTGVISSIRVSDHIRDPEIPITLPPTIYFATFLAFVVAVGRE